VTRFDVDCPLGRRRLRINLAGAHNVLNALAAAAAAANAGADLDSIEQGLAGMRAVAGRLELKRTVQGAQLIDDSYNANPGSMRAGLDALAVLPGEHWFVMGEMAELGPGGDQQHVEVGRHARASGVTRLFAVGAASRHAVEAFGAGAAFFPDLDELIAALEAELTPQVTVLVKGSRVNRLERVAAALTAPDGSAPQGAH
jgi:UDP-N-acetylmuramoyl-tripeptide--D-alanyl-D-alanine ligase